MDREKVIKGLGIAALHLNSLAQKCDIYSTLKEDAGCCIEAIELLKEQEEEIENLKQTAQSMMEGVCLMKEQEAVVPVYTTNSHPFHIGILYRCGNCHHSLIRDEDLFCRHCGKPIDWTKKAVKWE